MQTGDNLRKFRRDLAGRGVNIRSAIVDGATAGNDVLVAGLGENDEIVSAENVSTPADLTLDMDRVAYTTFFASNKTFRITMNRPGESATFAIVPADVDEATSVQSIGGVIVVRAHVSSGTTIDLTAAQLVAAVNQSEARKAVTASLPSGTGATAVTAFTANTIGLDATTESTAAQTGYHYSKGPLAASVDMDSQTAEAVVTFTARIPGAAGNSLNVQYLDSADIDASQGDQPTVAMDDDGETVVVTIDSGVTTAAEVVSAVNAANMPVKAALTSGNDGSGVVVNETEDLAGGRNEGRLRFTASNNGAKVRVAWVGRA
jgi:hypothetical protein